MKRSSSSDGSEANRPDQNLPLKFNPQQMLSPQQQKQIQAQQQLQQQQYQAQQQKQMQMQQQIQEFQQQQQKQHQQIQEYQQQQQFAANQQYYNQAAFFNYQQYVPSQSPLLYNSGPSWNYITTPPPFFTAGQSPPTPQPPLPPPDLKPEKPPLPKDPEPGNDGSLNILGAGLSGLNGPRHQGIRVRGLNGINSGIFTGINGGPRPNGNASGMPGGNRNRRRNPHFFSQMQPPQAPLAQDLTRPNELNDLENLLDEDLPTGAEKFTIYMNSSENGRVQINKKAKRKPMSTRYTRTKFWVREEAEAALALEKEFNRTQKRPMLILKFPDPDLNKYIVKKYSPFIDTVHFQQPSTPRYCFVQLTEDADVEKVASTIRQIPFGTGNISAEIKSQHVDDQQVTPEEIDPYTLYIGNLPTHISVRVVKQYFPNAQRIDIGYAQRMRYTRYAFIRYNTVAESMEAYKKTVNALMDSRSLIVRFRRQKGNIGLPGEPKPKFPKRSGNEESSSKEQNAPENTDEGLTEDDSIKEDECVTEKDRGTQKENESVNETNVSAKETASTQANHVNAKSTMIAEERQASGHNDNEADDVRKEKSVPNEVQKRTRNPDAEDTLSNVFIPESLEEEVDSKDKVMEQARQLMKKNKRRAVSPINFSAFVEPTDAVKGPVEGDIKLEHTDDEDSSDDGGINLLGTRVKDEPFDTPHRGPMDELYFDDYDYDDLCTDIEDDDDNWSNTSDRSRQLLTTNWELVRRSELNAREDKPDIRTIDVESHQSSSETAPIKANLKPKQEVEDLDHPAAQKTKRDQLAVKQELEDMFNRLNSDVECDDEDAFFGHT